MAQELQLTRGKVAIVDDADYDRVASLRWIAKPTERSGDRWYAYRTATVDGKPRTVYLHRYLVSAPAHLTVDHINGDGLDNRRCNLRLATRAQNNVNRTYGSRSGYRGVQQHGRGYRASIEIGGRIIKVAGALSAEEAARAYDALAREFQGEFAVLNFPEQEEAS